MWRVKYGDMVEVRAGGDGLESVGRVDSHDFVGEASPRAADVECFGVQSSISLEFEVVEEISSSWVVENSTSTMWRPSDGPVPNARAAGVLDAVRD